MERSNSQSANQLGSLLLLGEDPQSELRINGLFMQSFSPDQLANNTLLRNSIVSVLPQTLDPNFRSRRSSEDQIAALAYHYFDLLHPLMTGTTGIDLVFSANKGELVASLAKYQGRRYKRIHCNGQSEPLSTVVKHIANDVYGTGGIIPFSFSETQFDPGKLRRMMLPKMRLHKDRQQGYDFVKVTRLALTRKTFNWNVSFKNLPKSIQSNLPVKFSEKDAARLQSFYDEQYPLNSFDPRWLKKGHFFGSIDRNGQIVSSAGARDGVQLPSGEKIFLCSDLATKKEMRRHDLAKRNRHYSLVDLFTNPQHSQWADAIVVIDVQDERTVELYEALGAHKVVETIWGIWEPVPNKGDFLSIAG